MLRQGVFDVVDDGIVPAERSQGIGRELCELLMGHGENDGVVALCGKLCDHRHPVVAVGLVPVDPGIVDLDPGAKGFQFLNDVDYPGVAQVRTVLFEGQAKDEDTAVSDMDTAFEHQLDCLRGDVASHIVVEPSSGENHLRVIADLLGLVGEIVGINADAVSANETRAEGEEVPLGPGCPQHLQGVDAQTVEDQGQFVDEGDVDVALGVFDDLGRLGHAHRTGLEGAGGDDQPVEAVDKVRHLGGGAGGDLDDGWQPVLMIAGVDALRTVPGKEIPVEDQTGIPFQNRHADLLGGTRIDGGFIDDHIPLVQDLGHGLRGLDQGGEVRPLVAVDGGGHGDDEDVAVAQLLDVVTVVQVAGLSQLCCGHLAGNIDMAAQLVDAAFFEVKAGGRPFLAEFHGQGQADIPKTDDADAGGVQIEHGPCRGGEGDS